MKTAKVTADGSRRATCNVSQVWSYRWDSSLTVVHNRDASRRRNRARRDAGRRAGIRQP